MKYHTRHRFAMAALVALAAVGGLALVPQRSLALPTEAAAPAAAGNEQGTHYPAAEFRLLAQKPRYVMVDLRRPDDVVGFTAKADFDRAVAAVQADLKQQAGIQSAGQWADIYSDNELRGDSRRIDSGWAVNDLRAAARGCGLFGCAGDWNDVISSVFVNGSVTLNTDAGYTGAWFWMGGYGWFNMSTYGYDNVFSSMNVWWQ